MNPEDIKIGERVSLSGYIANKTDKHFFITIHTGFNEYTKIKFAIPSLELYEIMPENGIKNTEPAPKYDPRRKFRRGDKVRVVEYKGRNYTNVDTGKEGVVSRNETGADPAIEVAFGDDDFWDVDPAYLELVTPAEERQKPYFVEDRGASWAVNKEDDCGMELTLVWFAKDTHPHAKEAAQAECDRLNAENRKEVEK